MTNTILVILVLLVVADVAVGIYSRRLSNNLYYKLAEKLGKTRGDLLTTVAMVEKKDKEIRQLQDELRKLRNKK